MGLKPVYPSPDDAVADIPDGATVMVGGFGRPGVPQCLVKALVRRGARDLTVISNACNGRRPDLWDAFKLVEAGLVRRTISSFPTHGAADNLTQQLWRQGRLEVEVLPQGTLAERIRAAGAGIGAFWVRTGVGTVFAEGKERRTFDGQEYVLEEPLGADYALLRAHRADTLGNLVYRRAQRNYGPLMAAAARVTIVEVDQVVEPEELDPELVVTPGVYVQRLVLCQE